ncbi:peptidoglycan editing factor PgeF [Thiovibrio frasassiensis]|uniref:Purine nucleoside phosphorylase n=1 Tax=Thiovibrio frasassiensis TaxID=2984131 RepID=A0A9X4MD10_9BACT|nr:peptidoglycan editing factor PgeF [Thiovibrio frasassiensis]MDG4475364.1 peptidoglycan editing factor PgeF [Thiovibrio frasassiensis]
MPTVSAVTFSRQGGASAPPYCSLNVGFHVGDDAAGVLRNRAVIKEKLGLGWLVSAKQVHGNKVLVVDWLPQEDVEHAGYDALMTNIPEVGLMIQQADCQAVMLYDPQHGAVANIHSGWRGSVANIIAKTLVAMTAAYGTNPTAILAGISPSLGPCCGEFSQYHTELPLAFHAYQVRPNYFNFWGISRDQLRDSGVPTEQIEIAATCTVCDENYFSYRREGVTGRFASVIGIKTTESGAER